MIAYRSLPTWRGEGALGAWVSRIAVRLALRVAAKRRNVAWLDPFAAESEHPSNPDRLRLGTTDAPDPAVHALRTERDVELRRAVASLDEPYREVVALRFFAERSLQEIAEADRSAPRHREDAPAPRPGPPAQGPRGGRPMTGHRPWGSPAGPFGSEELHDVPDLTPEDEALDLEIGRALERLAARDESFPPAAFSDRVMRAVSAEPRPAPAVAAAAAVRRRSLSATLASLGDAFRVSFGGARPFAARAQAFALVLLVVVALGGTTVGAASALGAVERTCAEPIGPDRAVPVTVDRCRAVAVAVAGSPSPAPTPSSLTEPDADRGCERAADRQ